MEKPFNPILGETFQGWVNGCPIYGEQISHHPPVSSMLLFGRGYKMSCTIEPKIHIGMNSANGVNVGECKIQFDCDPKNCVYIQTMTGEMHGVSYGERTYNLAGKSK